MRLIYYKIVMTFPSGYQRTNKKNLDDKTELLNSSENTPKNEKDINPIPTTIGEAVNEVIKTGKEVVIEGPQTAGELTGLKEGDLEEKNIDHAHKPSQNDNIAQTDVRNDAKLEIDVIKSPTETKFLSKEEKIIVNPKESRTDREANITTVTTIPTEGVNVEAQTEFTIPLKYKEKNIEVETDVKVNSTTIPNLEFSLDSRNIEKPNLSSNDELSREKNPSQSEFDKETINPKLLLEKEEHRLQEQNTSNFSSNPFITYSSFWQHIMFNWVSFYDEYLKNMIKFNELWFDKSKNIRSGSQQEQ
jgi:hypothetical protein